MKNQQQRQFATRDGILKMLSDEEVASVSTAETAERLANGDEYLDLKHLDRGVQRARGWTAPMGRVLPRKAVNEATWTKIIECVTALERATLN
jgi:hypothetical protein